MNRPHKNSSTNELIRQMLHSQHKRSTDQSDGDTVEEWKDELLFRLETLYKLSQELNGVMYNVYGCLSKDKMDTVIKMLEDVRNLD